MAAVPSRCRWCNSELPDLAAVRLSRSSRRVEIGTFKKKLASKFSES